METRAVVWIQLALRQWLSRGCNSLSRINRHLLTYNLYRKWGCEPEHTEWLCGSLEYDFRSALDR